MKISTPGKKKSPKHPCRSQIPITSSHCPTLKICGVRGAHGPQTPQKTQTAAASAEVQEGDGGQEASAGQDGGGPGHR